MSRFSKFSGIVQLLSAVNSSLNGHGVWRTTLLCYENQILTSSSYTRLAPDIINWQQSDFAGMGIYAQPTQRRRKDVVKTS